MVSTPLLLPNLKLLSVVNSDLQRTITTALLHTTHHLWVCIFRCVFIYHIRAPVCTNKLHYTIHHSCALYVTYESLQMTQISVDSVRNCLEISCAFCILRYIGALGARVICDNIPGLVNKQRQLCQRHPDIMQAIGEGTKEWIRECQHQFRHHRWNCSTLDRDHTVFGRVLLRSKSKCVSTCPPVWLLTVWPQSVNIKTKPEPCLPLSPSSL